mgnify:CR=1 FL=1
MLKKVGLLAILIIISLIAFLVNNVLKNKEKVVESIKYLKSTEQVIVTPTITPNLISKVITINNPDPLIEVINL